MNIYSGSGGLGSALTNPTELARRKKKLNRAYMVTLYGHVYADAESAYQALKQGQYHEDNATMAYIIAAKFIQHPELLREVEARGGIDFLRKCSHITGARTQAFKAWEGRGLQSRFIRNLLAGYVLALEYK